MTTTEAALRSFGFLGNEAIVHLDSSDTKGAFAVLEMRSVPGAEPPMHIHENEDEFFIVLEGRMKVICGGIETELSAGESAVAQRGTPHTFKILSPELRSLAILTPPVSKNSSALSRTSNGHPSNKLLTQRRASARVLTWTEQRSEKCSLVSGPVA